MTKKGIGSQLIERHALSMVMEQQRREIERAISNAKRTDSDKWFRRQWYRGAAMARWSPERKVSSPLLINLDSGTFRLIRGGSSTGRVPQSSSSR